MIEVLSQFLKEINNDKDFISELAKLLMNIKNALVSEGFTEEQALAIVCQLSNNLKSGG